METRAPEKETYRFDTAGMLVQSPRLLQFPWLSHGSTTRLFSEGRPSHSSQARGLREYLKIDHLPVVHARQKHTNRVAVVDDSVMDELREQEGFVFSQTDALVCQPPNVSIAIFTADCTPMFLVHPRTRMIALSHAGWRGTLGRIAERTVNTMRQLGAAPEEIVTWVGPAIGQCCYEVSSELIERFGTEFADASEAGVRFYKERMLDLTELNVFQLAKAGLRPENISVSGLCTKHDERFPSYRRQGKSAGRVVSAMAVIQD